MIKNITRLEQVIADKIYHFTCDPDSPIEHVKYALNAFIAFAVQVEIQIKKEEQEKSEAKSEEPVLVEEPPKEG